MSSSRQKSQTQPQSQFDIKKAISNLLKVFKDEAYKEYLSNISTKAKEANKEFDFDADTKALERALEDNSYNVEKLNALISKYVGEIDRQRVASRTDKNSALYAMLHGDEVAINEKSKFLQIRSLLLKESYIAGDEKKPSKISANLSRIRNNKHKKAAATSLWAYFREREMANALERRKKREQENQARNDQEVPSKTEDLKENQTARNETLENVSTKGPTNPSSDGEEHRVVVHEGALADVLPGPQQAAAQLTAPSMVMSQPTVQHMVPTPIPSQSYEPRPNVNYAPIKSEGFWNRVKSEWRSMRWWQKALFMVGAFVTVAAGFVTAGIALGVISVGIGVGVGVGVTCSIACAGALLSAGSVLSTNVFNKSGSSGEVDVLSSTGLIQRVIPTEVASSDYSRRGNPARPAVTHHQRKSCVNGNLIAANTVASDAETQSSANGRDSAKNKPNSSEIFQL